MLKERRKLVLLVRETPLHEGHLDNMVTATRLGAVIMPPVPAFYNAPKTVDDLVDHIAGRVLDQFGLPSEGVIRWDGRLHAGPDREHGADVRTPDADG